MTSRITDLRQMQGFYQQMVGIAAYIKQCSIEEELIHLVTMRASQINGCAFCIGMHARDALANGERVDRLFMLDAWRETDWFTDRERAALAWSEALTTLPNREVPDDVFAQVREHFSEAELGDLTLAVIFINGANRANIAFRTPPQPFEFAPLQRELVGAH